MNNHQGNVLKNKLFAAALILYSCLYMIFLSTVGILLDINAFSFGRIYFIATLTVTFFGGAYGVYRTTNALTNVLYSEDN